jgi:protein O-GlcNAc transferase
MASSSSSSSANTGTAANAVAALLQAADVAARGARASDAIAALHAAAHHPDVTAAQLAMIAAACVNLRLPAAALDVQQRLAALRPDDPAPWRAMAQLAAQLGAPDDVRHDYDLRAAERERSAYAFAEVAMRRWRENDFPRARDAFARARAVSPDYLPARWGEMQLPRELIYPDAAAAAHFVDEWRQGLAWFEAFALEAAPREELASCVDMATNFFLHYHDGAFVDEQRRYARVIERMMAVLHPDIAPLRGARDDARIRVGFCSSHLRHHTVLKLFRALIAGLPRDRFHVSAFHTAGLRDRDTDSLKNAVDAFDEGARPLGDWIARLREARLDALIHLDVGMQPLAQGLASRRLAPWQAVLWGHPVTSGFRAIDVALSSDAMEPPDGQQHYTETLIRLPRLGVGFAPPREPFDALVDPPNIAAEGVRVFVAQQAFKLMPGFDDILARIASDVPTLRLHMTPHPSARVRDALRTRLAGAFTQRGLFLEKFLAFFGHVSEAGFFALADRMDLNLDAPDWSGGNTTLEILWRDVPTVTLEGPLMRQRHTAAMLRLIGLDELVARDVDDYVRLAVRLCIDTAWRVSLRERIAERKRELYDDDGPADALAGLLERVTRDAG